ncbi:hypothetical protein PENTCL1PPCAC_19718, partial [Pristionchus entomophagus]
FTLILSNIEPNVFRPIHEVRSASINSANNVFVSPSSGMLLKTQQCKGSGNVTIFSGAGKGEIEDRYQLRSWPCKSMPDWIITFNNVITVQVDDQSTFEVDYSSLLGPKSSLNVQPGDAM